MKTIGFIGTGNMGSALARAAAASGRGDRLLLANRSPEKAQLLARELGGEAVDNRTAAREADYLFLGGKPHLLDGMLDGIRDVLLERQTRVVIVSMAAGWDLFRLNAALCGLPVVRIMPNIPAAVGAGIVLLTASEKVRVEEKEELKRILAASGLVSELEEPLLDAANGVTGCGPAFAALFIEALADGAVACGLPRAQAYRYAALMLKGSAELLLQSGDHPGVLKDRVCSPAGSTIQGVRKLEQSGFRAAVTDAVIATYEKKF